MAHEEMIEKLAQAIYESDPEGEYQQSDVEWRYNFAHQERYRLYARIAVEVLPIFSGKDKLWD